jgi:flagellar biosynthesis/type III secretory pathway protein FliH
MKDEEFEKLAEYCLQHLYIVRRGTKTKIETHELKSEIIEKYIRQAHSEGYREGYEKGVEDGSKK